MSRLKFGSGKAVLNPVTGITYLLRDEFTTDRAAGAVHGTAAEPGPGGNRDTLDTNSNFSISGNALVRAGGSLNDPVLRYDAVARVAGTLLVFEVPTTGITVVGYSNVKGNSAAEYLYPAGTSLRGYFGGEVTIASNITYPVRLLMATRTVGTFYFHQDRLVGISASATPANLFPHVYGAVVGPILNYIRRPADLWLPTPLASDGFGSTFGTTDGLGHAEGIAGGIGSGGGAVAWTGATWSVSAGKAINTPTLGTELLTDGGFENWTTIFNATNWTENIAGTSTINQELVTVFSGSNAVRMDIDASSSIASIYQTGVITIGKWYHVSLYARASTTGKTMKLTSGGGTDLGPVLPTLTTSYTQYNITVRATTTDIGVKRSSAASASIYLDDMSVKEIPVADLFASVTVSTPDVLASVDITMTTTAAAGLVMNLDSTSSPANYVIAYLHGTDAKLDKIVAGTFTNVITGTITYVAGARLWVSKIGTAYRLYYNNALVSSGTISDAGIINNARHGLFNTYSGNQLDNFVVYASGSEGQYSNLSQY